MTPAAPVPTGGVLGAIGAPDTGDGLAPSPPDGSTAGGGSRSPGGTVVPTTAMRDSLVASVSDAAHLDLHLDVVGTNFLLALILLLLIGISSALFNSTLDENRAQIEGWVTRPMAWARARTAAIVVLLPAGPTAAASRRFSRPLRFAAILVLTACVYGFLSPDLGFDTRSLMLFVALMGGLGIVTWIAEGGMAELGTRRFHLRAGVRIYFAALGIAIACVLLSRLVDFRPGILYGFVASFALLVPVTLGRRESAQMVLVPWLGLLAASLVAWAALVPLRAIAAEDGSWLVGLLEATTAIVFVAGLEGIFFNMIPIEFMDGAKVARWNPIVWAGLFLLAGFLFFHLLVNQDGAYLDAVRQAKVIAAIGVAALYTAVSVLTWSYFHVKGRRETLEEA